MESGEGQRPGHILGLDGLRAVSVLVVLLYHAGFSWMKGGYLGVEVFFVISGFLITTLLQDEARRHPEGRISLRAFWRRRTERLAPALLTFLAAVATIGVLLPGTQSSQFRKDLLYSLLCVENWYQIAGKASYFADQGLPLLRHLWSLAVEMQFYAAWPLLLMLLLKAGRRWAVAGVGVLALGAFLLMALRVDPHQASDLLIQQSLNRAYLGTDTRVLGMLVGAALALGLRPGHVPGRPRGLDGVALAALLVLVGLCARLGIEDLRLYRGGFLLVDGLTLLVILALIHPGTGILKGLLEWRPLKEVGLRSYDLYLWHWLVFRMVAPERGGMGWFLLRLALSLALSELTYRLGRQVRKVRWAALAPLRRRALLAAATLLVAGLGWEASVLVRRGPYVDEVQEAIRRNAQAVDPGPAPAPPPPAAAPPRPEEGKALEPGPAWPPEPLPLEGLTITAIGDSVMKGAAIPLKEAGEASLGEGHILINAEESRPFGRAVEVVRNYRQQKRLGDVVVVHLGTNNSSLQEDHFRRLMEQLSDRRLVLFLTAKSGNEALCDTVNRSLKHLAAGFPNARVFDWKAAAEAHPDYFYSDHTHLRPSGARFYAEAILAQVNLAQASLPPRKTAQVPG